MLKQVRIVRHVRHIRIVKHTKKNAFYVDRRSFPGLRPKKQALFDHFLKENDQKKPKFDMTHLRRLSE
jgi:hypothetical protein